MIQKFQENVFGDSKIIVKLIFNSPPEIFGGVGNMLVIDN